MGFGPCDVIDAVSGVEEGKFGDAYGGEFEDVKTTSVWISKFYEIATAKRFSYIR